MGICALMIHLSGVFLSSLRLGDSYMDSANFQNPEGVFRFGAPDVILESHGFPRHTVFCVQLHSEDRCQAIAVTECAHCHSWFMYCSFVSNPLSSKPHSIRTATMTFICDYAFLHFHEGSNAERGPLPRFRTSSILLRKQSMQS